MEFRLPFTGRFPKRGLSVVSPAFEALHFTRQVEEIYRAFDPLDLRVVKIRTSSGWFNYILRRKKRKVSPAEFCGWKIEEIF